ncbi:MAG: M48 family metallopeptidase [Clostridiales bacterium]|nr:M48 family metallopeptidase [Clostridiales bacterium]
MKNGVSNRLIISGIEIEVVRKKIKNMYLKVSAHDGKVSVSAPLRTKDEVIINFVRSKIDWIEKKKIKYEKTCMQNQLNYVDGETHYVWGKPYILKINYDSRGRIDLVDNKLIIATDIHSSKEQRERLLMNWYRQQLEERLPKLFEKWEAIIGVKASKVTIRNMKSRWGSCNTRDNRISINLQLSKKPQICLEYVVVHELVHILEPSHNSVFKGYMDSFLPNWRKIKEGLL